MNFPDFYATYPKKVARADAEKMWRRMSDADRQAAIEALPKHCTKWLHDGTEKQYIPHPASWLNGRRWEDEVEIEVKPVSSTWRQSEQGTMAMAAKVGVNPLPGEDYNSLRNRITAKLVRAA